MKLAAFNKVRPWLLIFSGAFLLGFTPLGCATRDQIKTEYHRVLRNELVTPSDRTVIVFLVDGLPVETLAQEITDGVVPNIRSYFIGRVGALHRARTVFPSLTYPSISALLTESPVDENGIFGNTIVKEGSTVNFSKPAEFSRLNRLLEGHNVFSRMRANGLKTASIDYSFHADADVSMNPNDLKAGIAVLEKDYSYVDDKLIDSLENLLSETSVETWPSFIFVHLVGVDFTSHELGPKSPKVKEYIERLDSKLEVIFNILKKAEQSKIRQIVALMTADHGFDEKVTEVANLEKAVHKYDSNIKVINEERFAALYFPKFWPKAKKVSFMRGLMQNPSFDIAAFRDGDDVFIDSQTLHSKFSYKSTKCETSTFAISLIDGGQGPWYCPEHLEEKANNLYYPYFISNLSHYFRALEHPDAVLIPKPGVALTDTEKGQHGGATPEEVFVPLLMRNGQLKEGAEAPPLWQLLNFM